MPTLSLPECAVLWFAEVARRALYRQLGHASLQLYATCELGFSDNRNHQFKRLADDLERLPTLREAVATGRVGWTKAQQVARVATESTQAAGGCAGATRVRGGRGAVRRRDRRASGHRPADDDQPARRRRPPGALQSAGREGAQAGPGAGRRRPAGPGAGGAGVAGISRRQWRPAGRGHDQPRRDAGCAGATGGAGLRRARAAAGPGEPGEHRAVSARRGEPTGRRTWSRCAVGVMGSCTSGVGAAWRRRRLCEHLRRRKSGRAEPRLTARTTPPPSPPAAC